jgi:hypothetical protein
MSSYLSRYLYTLRIQSGYESVAEYLRAKHVAISEPYYRALEAGKKSGKQLTPKTADDLCKALGCDRRQFYLHLMKDILPPDVFELLVKPVSLESFDNLRERQRLMEHDRVIYRAEIARARLAESYIPSEKAVAFLVENRHWLPLIHFIYLTDETDEVELGAICVKNRIDADVEYVIHTLQDLDLLRVEPTGSQPKYRIRRHFPIFRVPATPTGDELKRIFLELELQKSLEQPIAHAPFHEDTAFSDSRLEVLTPEMQNALSTRIIDFFAEMAVTPGPRDREFARPYFISLLICPRDEYRASAMSQPDYPSTDETRSQR